VSPVQSLQTTLAAEHAAVYAYGVIGGRVSASGEPTLSTQVEHAYVTHRGRRDQLTSMVRTAGGDPVASQVSYQLPTPCQTPQQLREAAQIVEQRCCDVYASMVGGTSRANRQWAIDALGDSAVRVLGFGGRPEAFPGAPEL
jgi:hypothetical protein